MTDADRIDLLQRALDQTGTLIARITPEQRTLPTPCEDWDVTTLVAHVVHGVDNFAAATRGEQPDWSSPRPPLDGDWVASFRTRADVLVDLWRATAEQPPHADMQITEQAVHAWDIARATAQPADALDPAVGAFSLAFGQRMLKPEHRGTGAFGQEVEVPGDAPVYDRLAAWFGRDPSFQPGRP